MTSLLEIVRWDMVAAGFQLALCAAVLAGWIRRRRSSRNAVGAAPEGPPKSFALEVMLQTMRQQAEQSLQCILAAVETERDRLDQVLAGAGCLRTATAAESIEPMGGTGGFRWGAAEIDDSRGQRYAALSGLAEQGLNPRQIADRLNLPAGEIELALKMRAPLPGAEPAGDARQ